MNYKKMPRSIRTGAKTESNPKGTIMSNNNTLPQPDHVSTEDRAKLEAWCTEARKRWDELTSRPIDALNPTTVAEWRGMSASDDYIVAAVAETQMDLDVPLPAPAWAAESEVSLETAGLTFTVTFNSREHRSGAALAWITQNVSVNAADDITPDGSLPMTPAGTVMWTAPVIAFAELNDLSSESALQLAAVLRSAAIELHAVERAAGAL